MRKVGKPTVKWPEDEENDLCGPKVARWRYKTKNRAECTSVVIEAHDSRGTTAFRSAYAIITVWL